MSRHKKSHGEGSIRKRGNSYQFRYHGEQRTVQAAEFPDKRELNREFRRWREELDKKAETGPAVTMGQLFDKFLLQHQRNECAETYIVRKKIDKYLRPRLGELDARTFNLDQADEYIDGRKQEKTPKGTFTRNGTINRELAIIVSSLRLMRPEPRILLIKKLPEDDGIRQGIVSEDDYRLFLRELENYQKPVWCFSYYTGVRQGQLFKLRTEWAKDALTTGYLEVPGWFHGQRITKNGEPHLIPIYTSGMKEFLRWALENGDPACPYLFQREGKQIKKSTFYCAMKRIAERIGRPDLLFHDLRRTAVTNMIDAGIPPEEAMKVSGHLDISMLKRYNIVTAAKTKASLARTSLVMAEWHEKRKDLARIWPSETESVEGNSAHGPKPN